MDFLHMDKRQTTLTWLSDYDMTLTDYDLTLSDYDMTLTDYDMTSTDYDMTWLYQTGQFSCEIDSFLTTLTLQRLYQLDYFFSRTQD